MARDVKYIGYFSYRTSETINVVNQSKFSKKDILTAYEILKIFPFTSERKAMSIIVKRPDGRKFLYTKGADSALLKMSDGKLTIQISDEVE